MTPQQGEVWWATAEDKRRPVLVVTRSAAVPVLNRITVAPITRTIREIPTEIRVGTDNGLPDEGVASFDNLSLIRTSVLTQRAGALTTPQAGQICRALAAFADC